MGTLTEYIRKYKNISFKEEPFNDLDSAIFSSLTYLDFDSIANNSITMKEAGIKFFDRFEYKDLKKLPIVVKKTVDNFKKLYDGDRYKNIVLSNYVKIVDLEKQFCALTYKLPNNTYYIAYEGTDDSLIGWQEDFEMIYKFPVPAQKMAIDYINKVFKFRMLKIYVGGHSKGANLAMTASMYARGYIKRRIIKVYNFDGPGFRKEQIDSKEYKQMLSKLKMFVPEQTVVGVILRHPNNYYAVKSKGLGLFQHNINNWQCYGTIFVEGNLSTNSKNVENRVLKWLHDHDDVQRKIFVDTLFETFRRCDISQFSELRKIKISRIIKLIKASRKIDRESKELVLSAIKIILFGDKDNIIEYNMKDE